jgi:ABC-type transport system involved in multi-copper enzyme maturation permease subunit
VALAIFLGSSLMTQEMESRTLYMILSRGVSRDSFFSGKILGLTFVLLSNLFFLLLSSLLMFLVYSGKFESMLFWAIALMIVEAMLIVQLTVFFSLLVNKVLAVIAALLVWGAGQIVPSLIKSMWVEGNPFFKFFVTAYSYLFPNFDILNVRDHLLYDQHLSLHFLMGSLFHGICYSLFLFFLAKFIFQKKDLH